jgi:hypothetical protein
MISTAPQNEPARLWDHISWDLIGEFGGQPGNNGVNWTSFHPTLRQLMVSSPNGEIRIHTLDTNELLEIGAAQLSRPMTDDECARYLRGPCTSVLIAERDRP